MAWRIHDSVVRGAIDNRQKGRVRGELWLHGLDEPVKLDLEGNACPDLAGCLLHFNNPGKTFPLRQRQEFNPLQRGRIGNLSASQKVQVFTVPDQVAFAMIDRGETPPARTANALYLEWFSEGNGRVIIESAEFQLTISAPEWRLTSAEEKQRVKDAEAGWEMFSRQLNEALEKQKRGQKDPNADWDEHDYEKLMKESDARTDKYLELLDKYGDSAEAHAKIEKEMGWADEEELTPEEQREHTEWIEEMNRAGAEALDAPEPEPDPAREGIDWVRDKHGHLHHPLQHRCKESMMKFWKLADKLKGQQAEDKDLAQFIGEWMTTGAKLAGALAGIAQDRHEPDAAFTVAYLKRALDHLHKSQAGLEAAAPKKLLPEKAIAEARKELFEIREGILKLMDEFRGRI